MKKKIILITGSSGFLGNTTVLRLVELNYQVRTFDIIKNNFNTYKENQVEEINGNICEINDVEKLFYDIDEYEIIFIHCAGIISIGSKYNQNMYDVNVKGVKNVVSLCQKYHVSKLIYISSVHAITANKKIITESIEFNPNKVKGFYAKTKALATKLVIESGLNYTVIHPSGIIGPNDHGDGLLSQLIKDYVSHKLKAIVRGGYFFVDVRDVSESIIAAINDKRENQCYIVANKYISIKKITDIIQEITKVKKIRIIIPMIIAKMIAPLAELYYKIKKQIPLFTAYSLYTISSKNNFSSEKAILILNIRFRPIEETICDAIIWLKSQNKIYF